MPKDLLYKSPFIIQYTVGNKIMATILANIYAISYSFIDKKFVETVCKFLKI